MSTRNVLIVGAGPAGASLAYLLSRRLADGVIEFGGSHAKRDVGLPHLHRLRPLLVSRRLFPNEQPTTLSPSVTPRVAMDREQEGCHTRRIAVYWAPGAARSAMTTSKRPPPSGGGRRRVGACYPITG